MNKGMGRCRERGGEPGIYAKKEAGKLPRQEGSDCIFEACSSGANPQKRRPRGAGESVDPLELPVPEEPMPCPNDGRLSSAYDSERDPGVGHAPCRGTPHILLVPGSGSQPSKHEPPTCLDSRPRKLLSHVKFRPVLRIGSIMSVHPTAIAIAMTSLPVLR
jgi:hypothetical protein